MGKLLGFFTIAPAKRIVCVVCRLRVSANVRIAATTPFSYVTAAPFGRQNCDKLVSFPENYLTTVVRGPIGEVLSFTCALFVSGERIIPCLFGMFVWSLFIRYLLGWLHCFVASKTFINWLLTCMPRYVACKEFSMAAVKRLKSEFKKYWDGSEHGVEDVEVDAWKILSIFIRLRYCMLLSLLFDFVGANNQKNSCVAE